MALDFYSRSVIGRSRLSVNKTSFTLICVNEELTAVGLAALVANYTIYLI